MSSFDSSHPSAPLSPWRCFWIPPLATMLVGAVEAGRQFMSTGGTVDALVIAWGIALWTGLPIGTAAALAVALLRRRAWPVPLRWSPTWSARWWAVAIVAVVVGVVGYFGVAAVHGFAEQRPIDARDGSIELWRSLVLLAAVPTVTAGWGLLIVARGLASSTSRGAVALRWGVLWCGGLLCLVHACTGLSALFFGGWSSLVAWLVACGLVSAAVAGWPACSWTRLFPRGNGVALSIAVLVGAFGLQHDGAKALLFHDARVFPPVFDTVFAALDLDGDGDFPAWLGGGDCAPLDPAVASHLPERPGNGVDDNCRLGDASDPPTPASHPAASSRVRPELIVLVTIDTVRADRLDLYGYPRATMPALSRFASSARVWTQAYSPSNHTTFSMLSLLSGQSPEFLVHDGEAGFTGERRFTHWLPQRLATAGYHTVAINPPLVATGDLALEQLRFAVVDLGPFDYHAKNRGTMAKQLVDTTLGHTQAVTRPTFLWLHIPDPHAHHESHVVFGGSSTADRYDDELRWVDMQLARLWAAIEIEFGSKAAIVVTSDHGEALGDHGAWGHGYSLYQGAIRVPLVVRAAGVEAGVEDRPVSIGSVANTVLDLVGQPPGRRTSYASLLSEVDDPVIAACPFFWSERRMDVALVQDGWKLVVHRARGTSLLFELAGDPRERRDRAADEPQRLETMKARLFAALEQLR